MPIDLKELSVMSGFSKSTVSKALNNSAEISQKTRDKINDLALAHNYIPNRNARALRNKKTYSITVYLPKHQLALCSGILEGIEEESKKWGYQVIICQYSPTEIDKNCTPGSICLDGAILLSLTDKDSILKNGETFIGNWINKFVPVLNYAFDKTELMLFHENRAQGKKVFKELMANICSADRMSLSSV